MDMHKQEPDDHRIALDARDWVVRLASGTVSESDLEAFHLWRDCRPEHRVAFERERLFWQQLETVAVVATPSPVRAPAFGRRSFLAGGAAVAATALIAAPRIHRWWTADFIAPIGEQASYSLPDGSQAHLNSGSTLRVAYGPDLRLVMLTNGEAEFQVKASPSAVPFRLAMLRGNTDMLAGRLSARVERDEAIVTILEEEAVVFGPAGEREPVADRANAVTIRQSQMTTYRPGEPPAMPTIADLEITLAWQQNKIIFEGMDFGSAVEEVGRYLREPVIVRPGIDRMLAVSGVFSTRQPLVALEALAWTQALRVRRVPGVAILLV